MNNAYSIRSLVVLVLVICVTSGITGCATGRQTQTASVVDFLYPDQKPVVTPGVPVLRLPLRVGIAFVPSSSPESSRVSGLYEALLVPRNGAGPLRVTG